MDRKLQIGIIVVLGIAITVLNPLISGVLAVIAWIYLVRMVRKQKNRVLNGQMESKITEWHLKRLKTFLIVAGLSFLVFIVSAIVHNVLYSLSGIEESVFFICALVALLVFIIATAGGLAMFLKGRQKPIQNEYE